MLFIALTCSYSPQAGFVLKGDEEALRALGTVLRQAAPVVECTIDASRVVRGYDRAIQTLIVVHKNERVRIDLNGSSIVIAGQTDLLEIVAENVESLLATDGGDHLHLEYHQDHFYLQEGSEPLVVTYVQGNA